jgi:hypothetical protein
VGFSHLKINPTYVILNKKRGNMKHTDLLSDSKGRINLGVEYAEQRFLVIIENDRIILEKAVLVPERELWLHKNQEAHKSVEKGIAEARRGKLHKKAIDLEAYKE